MVQCNRKVKSGTQHAITPIRSTATADRKTLSKKYLTTQEDVVQKFAELSKTAQEIKDMIGEY